MPGEGGRITFAVRPRPLLRALLPQKRICALGYTLPGGLCR